MRLIGLVLALGAIGWVLYQAAGGDRAETAVPEGHREALEKARSLESTLQAQVQEQLQAAETAPAEQ